MGKPETVNVTVPAKLFTELRVICVRPTVPGSMVSEGSERFTVIEGVWPAGLTAKVTVTGLAAAKY